jgi:hypothetical protein
MTAHRARPSWSTRKAETVAFWRREDTPGTGKRRRTGGRPAGTAALMVRADLSELTAVLDRHIAEIRGRFDLAITPEPRTPFAVWQPMEPAVVAELLAARGGVR